MKQLLFLLTALIVSIQSNAAKISLEELSLELQKVESGKLGVVVWDQRPQIVDGRQRTSLLGYTRSVTGIAYPVREKSDEALASILGRKIAEAHDKNGTETTIIKTTEKENWSQILGRFKQAGCSHFLVVKMAKLQFDGIMKFSYMAELDIEVYDGSGNLLKSVHVSDEREMGGNGGMKKKFPEHLKQIIQDALNQSEIIESLGSKQESSKSTSSNASDIIITKKGDEIEAKVEEITSETIKYRKATQPDGPIRNVPIAEVFMVKYADGTKELFD